MNKLSNHLTGARSRLLDAEALLNHLNKPENLFNLLENDSPEVTLGAMIQKAWDLVANASGDCETIMEIHDDEFKAEMKASAMEAHQYMAELASAEKIGNSEHRAKNHAQHMDKIDQIHAQTGSLLSMLMLYLDQTRNGGEIFSESVLENYVWQLKSNIEQAQETSRTLFKAMSQ